MAKKVEELELWRKATEFWKAVDPLLTRSAFERDWKLRNQLRDAIDSILSNISEGFEQSSDRGFAKYLYDAKGSTAEARRRLWMAAERKYIPTETFKELDNAGDQVARNGRLDQVPDQEQPPRPRPRFARRQRPCGKRESPVTQENQQNPPRLTTVTVDPADDRDRGLKTHD